LLGVADGDGCLEIVQLTLVLPQRVCLVLVTGEEGIVGPAHTPRCRKRRLNLEVVAQRLQQRPYELPFELGLVSLRQLVLARPVQVQRGLPGQTDLVLVHLP